MAVLRQLSLAGYKTIRELRDFSLGPLNVLIGANGAGKSNLLSFFRLLNRLATPPGELQDFIIRKGGGGNALLFDGAAVTQRVLAEVVLETAEGKVEFEIRLIHAAGDTLVFEWEEGRHFPTGVTSPGSWRTRTAGLREANFHNLVDVSSPARMFRDYLRSCQVYQFHNTSESARLRQRWDVADSHQLKEDGANLAPFLLRLRDSASDRDRKAYRRIVDTLRQLAPFFADFVLEPINNSVLLQWRERNSDLVFGAHQASDGTLRLMTLLALLLQPIADVPPLVILDEPELGLHPAAVGVVAGLMRALAVHRQLLVATQSPNFVDYFQPEDVVVVDRVNRESKFRRLSGEELKEWLEEYSLGELWEKNVLGGRPA